MSGAVETESPRGRPLSGGLWTLFSWLRRDEHASSDSLSSAGSDRTAASFAFLAPAHYGTAAPALLPPPPPPTDSYNKRVRDRNQRRQHERDVTLHRKYGLYGFGYSLPSGRRAAAAAAAADAAGERCERDRRAASECPRAHVPGKRRAPPPPSPPATLTRRRARKRPAPPPPVDLTNKTVNIETMNRQPLRDKQPPQNNDNAMDCKPKKYSKKDAQSKETKDIGIRNEKSFLKQMFENRKRNSAIETSSVKLLPNISELDKQAAEMIEKYRLKECTQGDGPDKDYRKNESPGSLKQQTEAWICTRCLRKYNSSVITCNYCLPLIKVHDANKSSKVANNCTQTKRDLYNVASGSSSGKIEDKEKLKEMLKEIKDSLPKKSKNDLITPKKHKNIPEMETKEEYPNIVEAPTLRIGSSVCTNNITRTSTVSNFETQTSPSKLLSQEINIPSKKELTTINSVIITQPVVLVHTQSNVIVNENNILQTNNDTSKKTKDSANITQVSNPTIEPQISSNNLRQQQAKYDLNTPLKISSLLNPIYVPKNISINTQTKLVKQKEQYKDVNKTRTSSDLSGKTTPNVVNAVMPCISYVNPMNTNPLLKKDEQIPKLKEILENKGTSDVKAAVVNVEDKTKNTEIKTNYNLVNLSSTSVDAHSKSNDGQVDQHARRRDLINQLERSIAKGDEHAAAEAAVKLAQLRLTCSVLSFSSQIVAEPSTSSGSIAQQANVSKSINEGKEKKEDLIGKSSQTNMDSVKITLTKQPAEKMPIQNDRENLKITVKENLSLKSTAKPISYELPKREVVKNITTNSEKKDTNTQNPRICEASTSKDVESKKENDNEDFPILIWVEDKEATRGPVQLHVRHNAVLGQLRAQAERSLGLAAHLQRWIVGRTLCTDDSTPLVTLAGPDLSAHFYLCLVESDTKNITKPQVELKASEDSGTVYNELVKLERQALVSNAEDFECGVCIEQCPKGGGMVLRECVHSFCKECLSDVVRHSEEPVVSCPAMGCRGFLQEREIRALVTPDDYEKWLARGLAAAESGTRNAFHCRTRDCTGWAFCDPGVRRFPCPVCKCTTCVPCQAIHEGESCEQHRARLEKSASSPDAIQTDEGTRTLLNTLISRGEALECPECSALITKKWGCDWVKCSACKTEICWVTKGKRWGPAGRGDTSGGCRCGIDGKRCHPSCGYCH